MAEFLSRFRCEIVYVMGIDNLVACAFMRMFSLHDVSDVEFTMKLATSISADNNNPPRWTRTSPNGVAAVRNLVSSLQVQEARKVDLVAALQLLEARTATTKEALVHAKRQLSAEKASIGWLQEPTPEDILVSQSQLEEPLPIVSREVGVISAVLGVRARTNPTAMHRIDLLKGQDPAKEDEEVRPKSRNGLS